MIIVSKTITLETPIQRGDQTIEKIELRKPASGELRGTSLVNLLNMDVAALELVLPRITTPPLFKADFASGAVDPSDLVQMGAELAGFLLTKRAKEDFPTS